MLHRDGYYGTIFDLTILKNRNLIEEEVIRICNKIKKSGFSTISISSEKNYGLMSFDEKSLLNLINKIKKISNCNLVLFLSINNVIDPVIHAENRIFNAFHSVFLDLKSTDLFLEKEEKKRIVKEFSQNINNKIFLNEKFLDLDEDFLSEYCYGFFTDNAEKLQAMIDWQKFMTIINFSANAMSASKISESLWKYILLDKVKSFVHCFSEDFFDLFNILQSSILLNDGETKIQIIDKIQNFESELFKSLSQLKNGGTVALKDKIQDELEKFFQKRNDIFFDIY